MTRVMISAGDASGDLHAAAFVDALCARDDAVACFGLGGASLEKAGVRLVAHQREIAIGGLAEVVKDLGTVLGVFRRMRRALREDRPDLLVLVDAPDFNLPLAGSAHRLGIPILYYVSPQVWAWRRYRIRKIARRVDRLCVIFPFEAAFYQDEPVQVDFVGHPLVDRLAGRATDAARAEARRALGIDPERTVVTLLPGSRRNEIAHCLPLYLETLRELERRRPGLSYALGVAPSIDTDAARRALQENGRPGDPAVELFEGVTHDLALASDLALAKPGTVTLELALLGTPTVVATRVSPISAALLRRLTHLRTFSLPNLVTGESLIPEFLQGGAVPKKIAEAMDLLLEPPLRDWHRARLMSVADVLGGGGAAERAAEVALEMVGGTARA